MNQVYRFYDRCNTMPRTYIRNELSYDSFESGSHERRSVGREPDLTSNSSEPQMPHRRLARIETSRRADRGRGASSLRTQCLRAYQKLVHVDGPWSGSNRPRTLTFFFILKGSAAGCVCLAGSYLAL